MLPPWKTFYSCAEPVQRITSELIDINKDSLYVMRYKDDYYISKPAQHSWGWTFQCGIFSIQLDNVWELWELIPTSKEK